MSQEILVSIDTETGGFDCHRNALLTIGVHAENYNTGEVVFSREFKLNGPFKVVESTPKLGIETTGCCYVETGALKVNKLDISDLEAHGMRHDVVDMLIHEELERLKLQKEYRVIPLGQNLKFDLGFIMVNLPRTFMSLMGCRYHRELSSAVTAWHVMNGKPYDTSVSLDNVRKELQLESAGQTHSALVDAIDTLKVWRLVMSPRA